MKTFTPKSGEIKRKWHIIDADGKTLGKLATIVADKLRGKDKPIFSPHMDCGDFVIIINTEKVRLTGNKGTDKIYYRHSGFPGGIIAPSAADMRKNNPNKILSIAISGMIPKNRLRKDILDKLKLYPGSEHPHEAQKPEILEV
ncbi:MAG: 50S ribosomal protein L13 [Patescibacteria group bacterium]